MPPFGPYIKVPETPALPAAIRPGCRASYPGVLRGADKVLPQSGALLTTEGPAPFLATMMAGTNSDIEPLLRRQTREALATQA